MNRILIAMMLISSLVFAQTPHENANEQAMN